MEREEKDEGVVIHGDGKILRLKRRKMIPDKNALEEEED